MVIDINDNRIIKDIKEEFNGLFPHLKIEFYTQKHSNEEGSRNEYLIDDSLTIADARTKHNSGKINIVGEEKTSDLERDFEDIYGLHVQVFRKSGKLWIQTTSTDDWTLSKQEEEAL